MNFARLRLAARLAGALLLLAGAAGALEPITSCEPVGNARPVCGFRNPEDLAALPDGHTVIASEYGASDGSRPGALSSFDLRSGERMLLYRGGETGPRDARWGDPDCPGPPERIGPHGIDVARRPDGRTALWVVQHAGRESVELFEALHEPHGWRLEWRGCVPAPENAVLNDVAALPDGGFLTSEMYPREGGEALLAKAMAGELGGHPTGRVHEWQPGRGWRPVPGTAVAMPNGLAVSPDGATLYLNSTFGHGLRVIDRRRGAVVAHLDLPGLDNATWAPDGRLLVASILGTGVGAGCVGLERGACPIEFQILAVDPSSLAVEVLYRGGGAPMGAGTVGLQVGRELLIGSFASDRILRVDLSGVGAAPATR